MYAEITKEFFNSIKNNETKCIINVIEKELHRDVIYLINNVIVLERNNYLTGVSYHIKDINA